MPQVLVSHEQSSKVLIFSKGVKTALLKIEWQNNEKKRELKKEDSTSVKVWAKHSIGWCYIETERAF